MLISTLAATLLLSPRATTWKAGEFIVEVIPESKTYVIKLSDNQEITRAINIESIAYALGNKDSLSITGNKSGRQFLTRITPASSSSLQVETTFLSDRTPTASQLFDEYAFPAEFPIQLLQGGLAPAWSNPFALRSSSDRRVTLFPNHANFRPNFPLIAFQDATRIGYQAAIADQDGNWRADSNPQPIPRTTTFSYYLSTSPITSPAEALTQTLSETWQIASEPKRLRAFPQQVPFVVAAYSTFQFRRTPVADSFDPSIPTPAFDGASRWITIDSESGAIGYPEDQFDTVSYRSHGNALMVAYAMKSWGTESNQAKWKKCADELIRFTLASPTETGFPTELLYSDSRVESLDPLPETATNYEATTALAALRIISEFPGDSLSVSLTQRVVGVFSRIPQNDLSPEFAALVAAAFALPNVPAEVRQAASQYQVPLIASFSISDSNRYNPATLEALYWLSILQPTVFQPQASQLIQAHLLQQRVFDTGDTDYLASFGAFRSPNVEFSQDTPVIASLIGRFGILMNNAEWLDRSAFALRSLHAIYQPVVNTSLSTSPQLAAGVAQLGFGTARPNQPDPRISFESAEGLINTSIWEVLRLSGGAFTFPDGKVVGVDGTSSSNGQVVNTLFANPLPFNRAFIEPTRNSSNSDRLNANDFSTRPAISRITIENRNGSWFVFASPGLTMNDPNPVPTGNFTIGGKTIKSELGAEGFEAQIPADAKPGPITFTGRASNQDVKSTVNLPEGAPLTWAASSPEDWFRTGDLRWLASSIFSSRTTTNFRTFPATTGTITSPILTSVGSTIEFDGNGSGDCALNIIDSESQTILATWFPQGKPSAAKIDIAPYQGRKIQIEIVDKDSDGGFIELNNFRITN